MLDPVPVPVVVTYPYLRVQKPLDKIVLALIVPVPFLIDIYTIIKIQAGASAM
jgi:hypothetical protein